MEMAAQEKAREEKMREEVEREEGRKWKVVEGKMERRRRADE